MGSSDGRASCPTTRLAAPSDRRVCEAEGIRDRQLLAGHLLDEPGMLGERPALQRATLLPSHGADVQRVGRLLVLGLLQLTPIDELDVGDRRPRRLSRVLSERPRRNAASTAGKSSPSAAAARSLTAYSGRIRPSRVGPFGSCEPAARVVPWLVVEARRGCAVVEPALAAFGGVVAAVSGR